MVKLRYTEAALKFRAENGYDAPDEIPGWIRAKFPGTTVYTGYDDVSTNIAFRLVFATDADELYFWLTW